MLSVDHCGVTRLIGIRPLSFTLACLVLGWHSYICADQWKLVPFVRAGV